MSQRLIRRLRFTRRATVLSLFLVASVVVGVGVGFLLRLRPEPYTKRELLNLRLPGDLLMNMLNVLILPITVSSIVSGLTSMNLQTSEWMGLRTLVYVVITTLMAVLTGIYLAILIRPGEKVGRPETGKNSFHDVEVRDSLLLLVALTDNREEDIMIKMIEVGNASDPQIIFLWSAIDMVFSLKQLQEKRTEQRQTLFIAFIDLTKVFDLVSRGQLPDELEPYLSTVKGINLLGLVVISVATASAISYMGEKGHLLKTIFDSIMEVCSIIMQVIIWYSPIGIIFLLMREIVALDVPAHMFKQLSYYIMTVTLGLFLHAFLTLPFIYFIVCRRNPYIFMKGIQGALITAFGTASSIATIPFTMHDLEENNNVDPRVVGFVVPVGATINMNGTALYQAVAVIFIAQIHGIDVDMNIIVLLTDRLATYVNVLGDSYGAATIQTLCNIETKPKKQQEKTAEVSHQSPSVQNSDDHQTTLTTSLGPTMGDAQYSSTSTSDTSVCRDQDRPVVVVDRESKKPSEQ
ncbi:excitatory amino acid transporter 1-like [Babylonia areolata]|uniref:excitatory amino acid transporter 1-like n=1 Tax=Babylonia areolata TaxID=304850 RepID=UPI003FD00CD7